MIVRTFTTEEVAQIIRDFDPTPSVDWRPDPSIERPTDVVRVQREGWGSPFVITRADVEPGDIIIEDARFNR